MTRNTTSNKAQKKSVRSTASKDKDKVDHPIGTYLHVSWRGGIHRAQIIEKRSSVLDPSETEYYVHYTNCMFADALSMAIC